MAKRLKGVAKKGAASEARGTARRSAAKKDAEVKDPAEGQAAKKSAIKAPPRKKPSAKKSSAPKTPAAKPAAKEVRSPAKAKRKTSTERTPAAPGKKKRAGRPAKSPATSKKAPAKAKAKAVKRPAPVRQRPGGLELLEQFLARQGWHKFHVRLRYKGFHLGHWVSVRRNEYRHGTIDPALVERLEAIPGWSWDPIAAQFRDKVEMLREFAETEGLDNLRSKTVLGGVYLGEWAAICRAEYRDGKLSKWLIRELEKIPGWSWEPKQEFHRHALKLLQRYVAKHGWENFRSRTVVRGVDLGGWATRRRADYRQKQIATWLKKELAKIPGWKWRV